MIDYADLYQRGLPPVTGGTLDQCKCFNDACRFLWSEQRYWKIKANPFSAIE